MENLQWKMVNRLGLQMVNGLRLSNGKSLIFPPGSVTGPQKPAKRWFLAPLPLDLL
jgi:hypothetical protein